MKLWGFPRIYAKKTDIIEGIQVEFFKFFELISFFREILKGMIFDTNFHLTDILSFSQETSKSELG